MAEDANLSSTQDLEGSAADSAVSCSLLHPRKLGRYTVLRRIGKGGFGEVLLAHDEDLDRAVAIKVPRAERVSRPADVEAFLNEARILASLDHPHIVPVHDVGRTEDGLCFVVSKFIAGSDLATRIEAGRMGFRESAEMVATVAEALHYAHTGGLVHRDIKPSNILIDARGKPYVADFGLALKDEDFGKAGGLAGTPSYMSPEQARGEGHLVDGRSDIFSLGVVFYELLAGRRPFRGGSYPQIIEQVTQAEARPPRQIDDSIPKELERICLKAMAKRACERYTTARDMAEDLRVFLEAVRGTMPAPAPEAPTSKSPGSTLEEAPLPPTSRQSDSDQRAIKIIPKGLRSFDEHDADFFLELLPGPRDRDGLPESIRFWRRRIEQIDPDLTFRVGLIYGPSGCGKSSLMKAGLLPQLGNHVLPVYVEATPAETEARLLKGIHKACPELPAGSGLIDSLANLRRGCTLPPEHKALLVLDQFEQWLHARRGDENTELVSALRQCDGEHLQALVLVRDDFWLAVSRFMSDLEIELVQGQNTALVDLFDPQHARKVLAAFGTAYGKLPERERDRTQEQQAFLDQAITGLAQDGKVISVRLALFAEMMKGKPWTPTVLRAVGGTEGVGATFLEETFSSPQANPKHRVHQKAAQAVLKALLPETGTDIKGQMQSEGDLRQMAAYGDCPQEFAELMHILDNELRLITPTDPEGSGDKRPAGEAVGRYYQLTHDYLVHSLRDWLTRKQRETRRGRAELRLAEHSALWNAKPENRRLPSAFEWANIRLLTKKKNWTDQERRMMKRAGLVHGLRALGMIVLLSLLAWGGMEGYGRLRASALTDSLQKVSTPEVPAIVEQLSGYRSWADPQLMRVVRNTGAHTREHLHASLALLPVDAGQADYLFNRLLGASPSELPVLRDALKTHRVALTPKLWTVLESAKPGNAAVLPAASALASYAPDDNRWKAESGKVAEALVSVNAAFLGPWMEALRPVHGKLTGPLATIFQDKSRRDSVHSLATDVLTDYASDDPERLAELLMVSDAKAYMSLFPVAEKRAAQVLPVLQAELAKKAMYSWNDPPPDQTWTSPDPALVRRIESYQGVLSERFAFCQTMPMEEFRSAADALRKSGYRPVRFRPYGDGQVVQVAAVWTRDGRNWRIGAEVTADQVRQQDERNRKDKFLPVDVAGYTALEKDGRPADLYAALWVVNDGDDVAQMHVGTTALLEAEVHDRLKEAKLIPRSQTAHIASDGRTRYCGVWGRPPAGITGVVHRDQFEWNFEQKQADLSDQLLIDIAIGGAGKKQSPHEQAQLALESAEKTLKTKPEDLGARLSRGMAYLRMGENQKALDDLQVVVAKDPKAVFAKQYRVIALAGLGKKQDAQSELEKFEKGDAPEQAKLYLAAVAAAELGEPLDRALDSFETALQKQPKNADLRYEAARAFSRASSSVSPTDKTKGHQLAERSLQLLWELVKSDDIDFAKTEEDSDFDPVRDEPAFAEIMKAGHADRRYAAVWDSDANFEAIPIYGVDPAANLHQCRELIAQGYRPASLSVARTTPDAPLASASVWHRPAVQEDVKDRLAERQARAAIALARMGKAGAVWPLLRHSADPRLRSFIINWLNPLGADPKLIVAELDGIDPSAKPTPAPVQQRMEPMLFDRETSIRRALILALGTYGTAGLSPGERQPLVGKLLDLYRNDPDAGIHGAAAWTLRKWGQQDELTEADAQLIKVKDHGRRRWFTNGQGQTFAVIEGPVEFRMGSPQTETERYGPEARRRTIIPRRFAIATTEVTVDQYQRFGRKMPHHGSEVDRYSPDHAGPQNGPSWYDSAAYCNWLSEQEGLAKDQWCYLPNEAGAYAEGMSIAALALERTGYRLPTEAEWEYACRAGAVTSRYYGHSITLLDAYAWYQANSKEHAWMCGSLLPNDLGLFDMLGNVFEWCQDRYDESRKGKKGYYYDQTNIIVYINNSNTRLLRGGTFNYRPASVRSAYRDWGAPALRLSNDGFRPARTYH